jgi:predicted  nucleic acid-binding Zn-ribbon protein
MGETKIKKTIVDKYEETKKLQAEVNELVNDYNLYNDTTELDAKIEKLRIQIDMLEHELETEIWGEYGFGAE